MLRLLDPEAVHKRGVLAPALALTGVIVATTLTANMVLQFIFFAGWVVFVRSILFTVVISLSVVGPVIFLFYKLYRALYLAKLEVELMSRRDPLTGVANRSVLMERLAAVRGDAVLAILDIDHFKLVNDRHGHPAGDAVLVHVAECLQRELGATGCVARIGGEEFALLAEAVDLETVVGLVEATRRKVEASRSEISGGSIAVTISAGIAAGTVATIRDLYATADSALYVAKASGRNRVHVAGTPIALCSDDLTWAEAPRSSGGSAAA